MQDGAPALAQKGNKPQTPANTACGNKGASFFCVLYCGKDVTPTIGHRAIDGAVGMHELC